MSGCSRRLVPFRVPMGAMTGDSLWERLFVVSGLSAAAVAAPLLDIYGRNPEVFVANRTSGPEIVIFGLILTFAVPVISFLLLWAARRVGESAERTVYNSIVILLSVAIGLVVSRQVFPDSVPLALATAAGVAILILLLHRSYRGSLTWFALALPVVLVMFLATSASARLVWAEPDEPPPSTAIENPAPIVFIQLDELPVSSLMDIDGTVNATLFPNFARLAEQGTWYRNTLSDSIATTQSVPAILTGKKGEKGLSPSSVDHPKNLFNLLSGSHEMHVIEWIADMCPEEVCPDYAGRAPARFSALLADVSVVYGHLTFPGETRERLPSIENAWKGFLGDGGVRAGSGVDIDGLPVPDHGDRVEWVDWVQRLIDGIDRGSRPQPPLPTVSSQSAPRPWH